MFGQDQDKMILIPLSTAKKLYGERAAEQIMILAQAVSSEMADLAVEEIERVLRRRHGIAADKKNDFAVHTQDQALEFFNKSSRVATFVLAGIVSISLLVGGIGIMNIMLVSVTERTREIGVLKALGARDKDILVQFLTEAIVLSGVGGMLGIVLGAAGSLAISYFSPLPPATVPAWSIALGFAFSAGVGVFFGSLMRGFERSVTSLFGSSNARYIKRLQSKVDAIGSKASVRRSLFRSCLLEFASPKRLTCPTGQPHPQKSRPPMTLTKKVATYRTAIPTRTPARACLKGAGRNNRVCRPIHRSTRARPDKGTKMRMAKERVIPAARRGS